MKRLSISLTAVMALTACTDDDTAGDNNEEALTSGGATTSPTSGNPNPSAPTITNGDTSGSDPTTADTGADTEATDSTDADPTETGEGSGSTGEDVVDPADLPFGGYVDWTLQGLGYYGSADFYTVEYPDDPNFEPPYYELPVEVLTEDEWIVILAKKPGPKTDPPIYTDLDIGPQLFIDGTDVSLTAEYSAEGGEWAIPSGDLDASYAGGAWTVDIPGNDMFPAAVFEDVITGVAGEAPGFEVVTDADGFPVSLTWELADATFVGVFMGAFGPQGQFQPLCFARLEDDGEAAIPSDCADGGPVPLDPAGGLDTVFMVSGQNFHEDVAYDGRRLRFMLTLSSQLNTPFPYTP